MTDVEADPKLQSMYCSHMQEIKNRSGFVRSLLSGKRSLGSEFYDYEVFALNMRKILELIVFSSLIAHKQKYAEVRKDFHKHRKVEGIIDDLEKIHPHFYPVPADIQMQSNGVRHMQKTQNCAALTKEEFKELYNNCCKVLHIWNPFNLAPRRVSFRLTPVQWIDKTRDLLNTHYVHLADNAGYWLCVMQSAEDGYPHVYTLSPFENQDETSQV